MITTADQAIEKIDTVFKGPAREPYEYRVRDLFNLAKHVERGVIVELGTHHGYGAFALAYGSAAGHGVPVITIDDYNNHVGWAGEKYNLDDYKIFQQNINALGFDFGDIVLIRQDAVFMGEIWKESAYDNDIGLLYIDTGVSKEHIQEIVNVWKSNISIGGIMLFRDTTTRSLGTDAICKQLIGTGIWKFVLSNKYFTGIARVSDA